MTSVQGRRRPRRERPSVTPSIAPSISPPDSFLPSESGDKLSNQPAEPSRTKPLIANASTTATSITQYSENDLQRIFKAVLEVQAPVFAFAPAPVISEAPWEKSKAHSPDVFCRKSYMDCYNIC